MMPVQYITDTEGNKTAVVVTIEDWRVLQRELDYGTPEWHKEILEAREQELSISGKSWESIKSNLKRKN